VQTSTAKKNFFVFMLISLALRSYLRESFREIDGRDIENQSNVLTKTAQAVYRVNIRRSATDSCRSRGLTLVEVSVVQIEANSVKMPAAISATCGIRSGSGLHLSESDTPQYMADH
jgi:hypothetical protein